MTAAKPPTPTFSRRDVRVIEEVKDLLDFIGVEKRDPLLRRAFYEELIAEATSRLECL